VLEVPHEIGTAIGTRGEFEYADAAAAAGEAGRPGGDEECATKAAAPSTDEPVATRRAAGEAAAERERFASRRALLSSDSVCGWKLNGRTSTRYGE